MLRHLLASTLPLGVLLTMAFPVYSQVDPQLDPLPLPEPIPDENPLNAPPPVTEPGLTDDTTPIDITTLQIVGSTVFSPEELAELVAPYENRTTTLAELQTLADDLNQRYLDAGYITTQVRIPEQTLTNGVVTLEVLEGRLADITVEGAPRYRDYITSRLNQASTDPLNQAELEDQLQLLQLGGLFDSLQGQLSAGDNPGESVLSLEAQPASPFSGSVFVDNYSPTSVGQVRLGSRLSYRSLGVPGDALTVAASLTTTGGAESYSLGYQVPLGPQETTLRLGFSYEDFNITDTDNPAFALGIRGDTRIYEAELRHPLIRTPREELALSLGFRHRDGRSILLDTITLPSRTTVLTFAQDYLRRDGSGAWAARSQFNLGTGLLDATLNPSPQADGRFLSWQGQVQRVQVLSPDNLLILRADLQLAGHSLLGSEQFVLGGAQSVRGYRQNVRSGDNGFRFSVEDRIVVWRRGDQAPLVQLAPFTDLGAVWFDNVATQPTQQNWLWGAGLGLIVTPLEGLTARADLGFPLVTLDEVSDRPSGAQLYFSLDYAF